MRLPWSQTQTDVKLAWFCRPEAEVQTEGVSRNVVKRFTDVRRAVECFRNALARQAEARDGE